MLTLVFARQRIQAFADTIEALRESEFPYHDSRRALDYVSGIVKEFQQRLARVDEQDVPSAKEQADEVTSQIVNAHCNESVVLLFKYLPLLGFILRSTDVRNGFELFGPLRRIARKLLEPTAKDSKRTTKLLLSSEWDYAPQLRNDFGLRDFVIIGLPAHEASNPLLFPLCGHELGHALWITRKLEEHYSASLEQQLTVAISKNWKECRELFPQFKELTHPPDQLTIEFLNWRRTMSDWLTRQAEESFCDFVGLRLFGRAYLLAFSYLLFPGNIGYRLPAYPNNQIRVGNMHRAMAEFGVSIPDLLPKQFSDRPESPFIPPDRLRLRLADDALVAIVPDLIKKAKALCDDAGINPITGTKVDDEIIRVKKRLSQVVPAGDCTSLADILNAGWQMFEDPKLWSEERHVVARKSEVLRELLLKNIELLEVEQIKAEHLDP
jgi:hypothetical protein